MRGLDAGFAFRTGTFRITGGASCLGAIAATNSLIWNLVLCVARVTRSRQLDSVRCGASTEMPLK